MAGDVTQYLISVIRDTLGQYTNQQLLKTDSYVIHLLNKYQSQFMSIYKTTEETYTITLTAGTYTYTLHPRLFEVTNIRGDDDNVFDDYKGTWDKANQQLILDEDDTITTGDKLYVTGFIKPVLAEYSVEGGEATVDSMSKTFDPLIQEDYHPYLIEAVLAHFRHINEAFAPLETIWFQVAELAKHLDKRMRAHNRDYE